MKMDHTLEAFKIKFGMDLGFMNGTMEISTLVNGRMENLMVLDFTISQTLKFMKASGKIIINLVQEFFTIKEDQEINATILMI